MTKKDGVKVVSKCPVINIHANFVENSYPLMIMYARSVGELTLWDLKGAQNVETQLKPAKLDAAVVV